MSITTYSAEEVATGLGCTVRWLTEQARHGRIPARRVAKQWRFTQEDCADIITQYANGFCRPQNGSPVPAAGLTQRSRSRLLRGDSER